MIEFRSGDILKDDAETLVNTVNCVGVMGRGIALQFENAFPENFKAYAAACRIEAVQPGRMFVFETGQLTPPRFIINFPTKRHWRGKSRIADIEAGLEALVEVLRERRIRSVAIPPLGSGLVSLDWREVKPLIERALQSLADVRVSVYEPDGAPASDTMKHAREVPKMDGRACRLGRIDASLSGRPAGPVRDPAGSAQADVLHAGGGRTAASQIHPGALWSLCREPAPRVHAIEGHLVSGCADGGDAPDKQLNLVPGAVEDAAAFLKSHKATRARFDKVAELVEGFESPAGLELLATVHWVMTHETVRSADDVLARTYAWNPRKRQFTPRQIGIALDVLSRKGWVGPLDARSAS